MLMRCVPPLAPPVRVLVQLVLLLTDDGPAARILILLQIVLRTAAGEYEAAKPAATYRKIAEQLAVQVGSRGRGGLGCGGHSTTDQTACVVFRRMCTSTDLSPFPVLVQSRAL